MRYLPIPTLLSILLLPPASAVAQDPLTVVSIGPAANAVGAGRDAAVVIAFDRPVDPATFEASSFMVFGRWSGVMPGEVTFEEGDTRVRFTPGRPFSAGETVTVSLARRVAAADGGTLGRGYAWQYWTRPRRASLTLRETARLDVRRAGEGHIQTYGAYAGDFDGDGYTDFAVPNERSNDVRVFMNDGRGGFGPFTVYPIVRGEVPSTNEGADFNGDGHLDFAVGNSQGDQVSVFMGDGTGRLSEPVNYTADEGVRGLAVLDLNGDGYPDIATANRLGGSVSVLLNDGDGTFTSTPPFSTGGAGETAAAAADFNEDGLLDLAVGTFSSSEIVVLLGDGEGGLVPHARVPAGGTSWMIATGDVDGDGHADVVSANALDDHAAVLFGDGRGGLDVPRTYPTGGFPLAVELGDLDGDGDLDLVTSNFNGNDWTIYENVGGGALGNRRSLPAGRAGSCAVLHDRDNDGALDMTGIDELDDQLFLFTNTPLPTAVETPTAPDFDLGPNYPNPFSNRTTIPFRLEAPAAVRLALYDILGRAVRVLLDGPLPSGAHAATWDGLDDAGRRVTGGVYVYRLETPGAVRSRSLLFLNAPRSNASTF